MSVVVNVWTSKSTHISAVKEISIYTRRCIPLSHLTVVYGRQRSVVQVEEVLLAESVVTAVHQHVRPPHGVLVRSTPVRVRQARVRLQRMKGIVPAHVARGGRRAPLGGRVQLVVLVRVLWVLRVLR